MCNFNCLCNNSKVSAKFQKYFRALHCPVRWRIIGVIRDGEKSTGEIFEELRKSRESLSKSGLYYHLSELEKAGTIELAMYREIGGGAPEKAWRLKTKEIKISLLDAYDET